MVKNAVTSRRPVETGFGPGTSHRWLSTVGDGHGSQTGPREEKEDAKKKEEEDEYRQNAIKAQALLPSQSHNVFVITPEEAG